MKINDKLKKSTKMGLIICLTLSVLGMAVTCWSLVNHFLNRSDTVVPIVHDTVNFLVYVFVLYYALSGYKIPHGNLLRAEFLVFSVSLVAQVIMPKPDSGVLLTVSTLCTALGALIVAYTAGRLNKIEKNRKLLILSGALLFAGCCLSSMIRDFGIRRMINSFEPIIVSAALGFAYTARFEEHRAAGLEDGN